MTTFHDPPPQSRRATRQSERERASDEQPTVEGFTTFPSSEAETNRADEPHASPSADAPSGAAPSPTAGAAPTVPPATAAEATAAPPAPVSSRPSTEAAYRAAPPPLPQTQNSAVAPPVPPAPSSFAPRAAADPVDQAAPVASAAPAATSVTSETGAPERTLTRRELRELRARQEAELDGAASDGSAAPEAAATIAPTEAPAPAPALNANADAVPHYPYSGSAGQPTAPAVPRSLSVEQEVPAYIEPPALVDPLAVVPEAASVTAAPENALSAFESLLANADGSAKDAAVVNDSPRSPLIDPLSDTGAAKSVSELNFGDAATPAAAERPSTSASAASQPTRETESSANSSSTLAGLLGFGTKTPSAPAAVSPAVAQAAEREVPPTTNLSNARAEFDEQARKRLEGELPAVGGTPAPAIATPRPVLTVDSSAIKLIPAGHWSRQAAATEEPTDSVISRTISSGSSATSALVLPAIPFATDIRGPLNSSGEAMLTGSIDLPSTLSASGVSDRFDHADIDSLLDLNDSDMVSTDSAPVRAVKAVSTFSNQSVTQTQKPKGTRALTVLLISACSMAVVVAGLLVAAFAFNML
ncbi:MAG: hypothetical protein ACOH14_09695 [Rhodoglobus sp.]